MRSSAGSPKPPVKYWTRTCLKCGRVVRIPRSRRTCQKCFLQNMEASAGVYGELWPGSEGRLKEWPGYWVHRRFLSSL